MDGDASRFTSNELFHRSCYLKRELRRMIRERNEILPFYVDGYVSPHIGSFLMID